MSLKVIVGLRDEKYVEFGMAKTLGIVDPDKQDDHDLLYPINESKIAEVEAHKIPIEYHEVEGFGLDIFTDSDGNKYMDPIVAYYLRLIGPEKIEELTEDGKNEEAKYPVSEDLLKKLIDRKCQITYKTINAKNKY